MGSPKALLPYRAQNFLERLCDLFRARCSPVIVVLGAGADTIRNGVNCGATFVINDRWQTGQTSSLQCGLRAVPTEAAGVLLTLVDHPAVAPETIDALLEAKGDELVRVPRFQGKRGHPIWFSRALIAEFLALPEEGAARTVVRSHVAETEFLDLDDPGIVADIDDPDAYRSLVCAES